MRIAVGFAWVLAIALGCGGSALSRSAASKGAQDFLEESGPYCLLVGLQTSAPPWVVSEGDPGLSRLRSFEPLGLARLAGEPITLTVGLVKTSRGWKPAITTLSP